MYSYSRDRDQFIARMIGEGFALDTVRALLRLGTTIQRLQVAQCNGDYPADGGSDRWRLAECSACEGLWAVDSLKRHKGIGTGKYCEECRAQLRVKNLLVGSAWVPCFEGDPRGATLKLFRADTTVEERRYSNAPYIYVPARER